MSYLFFQDEELNYFWNAFHSQQLVFHPQYAPEGKFEYKQLRLLKQNKELIVLFDRNLLSSLLKLCQQGYLKNEKEMRTIALLMLWCIMNGVAASSGLAIMENATKIRNSDNAKIELEYFVGIFNYYPSMTWKKR